MTLLERFVPTPSARHEPSAPVIPVIVLEDARNAVPLAQACHAGGLEVLEITLRTPAGLESLRRIAAEVPGVCVGAGTVTTVGDVTRVAAAGARFAVSPGFDRELVAAARDLGLPLMPGVMTPSEVMAAVNEGLDFLKLFPAAVAGGVALLKALAGPFPTLRFCATGGIDARNAAEYLALSNVVAVGGSWVTPASAIALSDWPAVTRLAREAAALRRPA